MTTGTGPAAGAATVTVGTAVPGDVGVLTQFFLQACAEVEGHRGGRLLVQRSPRLRAGRGGAAERAASSFAEELQRGETARRLVLGRAGQLPVGYASASTYRLATGEPVASLEELYVVPAWRRQGVGRALLGDVLSWAAASGCSGMDAAALPGSRAVKSFFEASGMRARALVMHRAVGER